MAELDVQPKRSNPWWLWLLLALVALGVLFYLLRSCNNNRNAVTGAATTIDSAASRVATTTSNAVGWDSINFNAPAASYEEITDTSINVRGNSSYAIYGLGENILFDTDKSTLRNQAEQKLKQIAGSLSKRFNGGEIRIYGYTDAQGSKGYNKQLAEQRAEAVRTWLVKNGNIPEGRISLHPVGEANPVASNATSEGRQQNRRVEIVARQQ